MFWDISVTWRSLTCIYLLSCLLSYFRLLLLNKLFDELFVYILISLHLFAKRDYLQHCLNWLIIKVFFD